MALHAELARLNLDPTLADRITDVVQKFVDQAQNDAVEARRQVALRDTELHAAQARSKH
jgi:hypothetical protein